MSDKMLFSVGLVFALLGGFFLGKLGVAESSLEATVLEDPFVEMSLIQLHKIEGDSVLVSISGPARILWGEDHLVEMDGEYNIPLGQIPHETDLALTEFPYVGNAKTMKFYPSDSYPARGTEVKHRRFFETKEDALAEGFIPMKNMK
jgi:hypothetical protein